MAIAHYSGTSGRWRLPTDGEAAQAAVRVIPRVRLRGTSASILYGWHVAMSLKSWSIVKEQRDWILRGTYERVDLFQARRRPLMFSAPREQGAAWAWGIESDLTIGNGRVKAILGPPEQ